MSFFPRTPIDKEDAKKTAATLQEVLVALIDLGLESKQAHWNVVGQQFLSVHEKLDAVVLSARTGLDVAAERMVQLGHTPDGRAATVARKSPLESYPDGFHSVANTLELVSDRLLTTSKTLRQAIDTVGDLDPLTEDQLIAMGQEIEEHLWMFQAMAADMGVKAEG